MDQPSGVRRLQKTVYLNIAISLAVWRPRNSLLVSDFVCGWDRYFRGEALATFDI